MANFNKTNKTLLLIVFIFSGFAGLIYQSIWSQYLGVFLGHAAYAQALVLAIFMGGMALGAIWIASVGERWRNLIRGYAYVEALIGLLGIAFHWIFLSVTKFNYDTLMPLMGAGNHIGLVRWVMAAILILPQTVLLGMTFPLMSGGLIRRFPEQQGNVLGGLYFTNSIGAALGALAAPFILLPWVGLPGAMIVAGLMNIAVALLALILARKSEPVPPQRTEEEDSKNNTSKSNGHPLLRLVLFSTALSGAASFAYEIIWVRMLSLAVGSTLHAFELMLASFVGGIALGGLWIRKYADRSANPLRLVGWMQVAMGVAALISLLIYGNSFRWVGWLISALSENDDGYAIFTLGTALISIAIMLPAAFFAGTTLPLFTVILLRQKIGERVIGQVYGWNTIGTIVGVFATMHWLIPSLGLKLSLVVAAMVDIAIGIFLVRQQAEKKIDFIKLAGAMAVAVLCIWFSVDHVKYDPGMLASGVFRSGNAKLDEKTAKVIYYRDGKTASISVAAHKGSMLSISTNGKSDAGIEMADGMPPTGDEATMTLLAALPLSLHQTPSRIGVIGFGSGMTTHTLLGDRRVERVDTIEIEPAMIDGARAFGARVSRAFEDPRSNIVVDDAKSYFSGKNEKYDIIISEPSNPWISGVGGLFSREFYEFVPRHLNENGLFVQWVQLYEIDDRLVSSIIKGIDPAFSDYGAWLANSGDLLIVAKPKGQIGEIDLSGLLRGPLKKELGRIGITDVEHLKLRHVASASLLSAYAELHKSPGNSYYYPLLSLEAPKTRFKKSMADTFPVLANGTHLLLEALGVRGPLPATVKPSILNDVTIEPATRLARANAEYLLRQPVTTDVKGINEPFNAAILLVHAAEALCKTSTDPVLLDVFSRQLKELTNITLATLGKEMQHGVLIGPGWLPCNPAKISSDTARVLDLLSAAAARDWEKARVLGSRWLKFPPAAFWRRFDELALSLVLLDLARSNDWDGVIDVERNLGASVKSTGGHMEARMLLLGLADAKKKWQEDRREL